MPKTILEVVLRRYSLGCPIYRHMHVRTARKRSQLLECIIAALRGPVSSHLLFAAIQPASSLDSCSRGRAGAGNSGAVVAAFDPGQKHLRRAFRRTSTLKI